MTRPVSFDAVDHKHRRRGGHHVVEAAAIRRPARIYDLRSTVASDALAAGVSMFELARIMGTSVRMIERHYGTLLDGAGAGIAGRLDALDMRPRTGCGSHLARLIRRGRLPLA